MDFIETLRVLSSKIQKQEDLIQTEEGTKNAFVLPFISALGYDIFEPMEVVPEFTAGADLLGIKKGERVDYAIKRDGKAIMLFECKTAHTNLDGEHASQLFHYFSATEARIAVLTDGIIYRFYSDIEQSHKMDATPFMEFNMLKIQEYLVPELKRLTKQAFNIDEIISVAGEMKYSREIKRILGEELGAPTDDFVKFLTHRVYKGILTQSVREQFTTIVKEAFTQFINETINERLNRAMTVPPPLHTTVQTDSQGAEGEPETQEQIIATPEELEGFYVVKAILRQVIDPARVTYRGTKNYFGILLDNTNHKPICRLYFDGKQKFISLPSQEKQWDKFPIEKLDDLFKYADRLNAIVAMHNTPQNPNLYDVNEAQKGKSGSPTDKPGDHVQPQPRESQAEGDRRVTLSDLVSSGFLPSDAVLEVHIQGIKSAGRIREGKIEVDDQLYSTPSSASIALRHVKAWNGWTDWQYNGETLAKIRERYECTRRPSEDHTS